MMLSQTSTLLDSTGPEWSRPESPSRACGQDRRDKTAITNSGVKARTGQVRPCNTTRAYGRGPDGQDRHDQPGRAGSDRIAWTGMRKPGVWAGPGCRTGITMPGVKRRECGRGWCMNLRSRGLSSLAPIVEDISALEREIVRRRREEEQQAHIQRLGFDMENLPQDRAAEDGQGAANLGPRHPQRQARAIGAHDQPNIHGNRAGIRAPAVENNNFEIKSSLINMIQSNK
ncbi:hypothetical protein Rs2_08404 [Raphanus sativus]|nr:hypothetical protein Rs2_08404 [Raphanus sativus]